MHELRLWQFVAVSGAMAVLGCLVALVIEPTQLAYYGVLLGAGAWAYGARHIGRWEGAKIWEATKVPEDWGVIKP